MKKIQLVFAFAMTSLIGVSQQMPQYSQYLRNQFMVNPAAAGVYDFADFTVSGRWQWVGFENSPKTAYASGTFVLGKKRTEVYNPGLRTSMGPFRNPEIKTGTLKHAFGGQMVADQYGAFQRLNAAVTYALHIPLSQKVNLAFGTKVGLSNNTFHQNVKILACQGGVDRLAGTARGDNFRGGGLARTAWVTVSQGEGLVTTCEQTNADLQN